MRAKQGDRVKMNLGASEGIVTGVVVEVDHADDQPDDDFLEVMRDDNRLAEFVHQDEIVEVL